MGTSPPPYSAPKRQKRAPLSLLTSPDRFPLRKKIQMVFGFPPLLPSPPGNGPGKLASLVKLWNSGEGFGAGRLPPLSYWSCAGSELGAEECCMPHLTVAPVGPHFSNYVLPHSFFQLRNCRGVLCATKGVLARWRGTQFAQPESSRPWGGLPDLGFQSG